MDKQFAEYLSDVEAKFHALVESAPRSFPIGQAPIPEKGVYLLSEGAMHLYVGRSDRIRSRLNEHQRDSADTNAASFAALLAREACGLKREYGPRHRRPHAPGWATQFKAAKARIRRMQVRVVAEDRAVPQALLEMYVATALRTPYNDFGNH